MIAQMLLKGKEKMGRFEYPTPHLKLTPPLIDPIFLSKCCFYTTFFPLIVKKLTLSILTSFHVKLRLIRLPFMIKRTLVFD